MLAPDRMLAEQEAVIAPNHHQGFMIRVEPIERFQQPSQLVVHVADRCRVGASQLPGVRRIRIGVAALVTVVAAKLAAGVPARRPGGPRRVGGRGEVRQVVAVEPSLGRGERQVRLEKSDREKPGCCGSL